MPSNVPPFAVPDDELRQVEGFCKRNGLDEIGRICAELRGLRDAYITLSKRVGRQSQMVEVIMPDPSQRFARELDSITQEKPDAAPVA